MGKERDLPNHQADVGYLRFRLRKSGKNIPTFAREDCGIAESTLRKMLQGRRVAAATLKAVAAKLKLPDWYRLLSDAEKNRLGLSGADLKSLPQTVQPTTSADPEPIPASPHTSPSYNLQLPSPLPDFTGRADQIKELASRLAGGGESISLSALRGMGGIGKTSLAIRVAHEVKDRFPDGQLFLSLRGTADGDKESPMTPAEAMACVVNAFHPEEAALRKDEDELAGIYRSVLAGKRVLILLDNARSESQLRPLLAAPSSVAFLITSRNAQALDGVPAFQVKEFAPEEAYLLLRSILPCKGSRAELARIAELCGHLPLALRVAGDFLRIKDDWPVPQYIVALERDRLPWLRIGDDPAKNVESVLKLSSAQLVRDSVDRATRWHMLHIFHSDFNLAAAASAWGADENDLAVLNDLSDMTNRSLIIYDPVRRRYRLHDLMRPIAEGLFGRQPW